MVDVDVMRPSHEQQVTDTASSVAPSYTMMTFIIDCREQGTADAEVRGGQMHYDFEARPALKCQPNDVSSGDTGVL